MRVLGPVSATLGARELQLGGRRARAALAYLALHRDRLVTSDRMVEALWRRPPATCAKVLQMAVSRLRKELGAALVTERRGYRLALPAEAVDIDRFSALTREARGRDPADIVRLLDEALALWRGDFALDLDEEPFVGPERARLDDLRLAAFEDRFDALLALSAGAELVGELEALIAEQPLRERLREQLMLALYRAGRQTDALRVYSDTRALLVARAGVEPGPRLRRLQSAILSHDPALEAQPARPGSLHRPRAFELVGRDADVDAVLSLIRSSAGGVVTLTGPGGVGKSRLAVEVARQLDAKDSVFVALDSVTNPSLVVPTILRALGETVPATEHPFDALVRRLERRPTLLVVDSFEHLMAAAEDIAGVHARAPRTTVLVTSREALRVSAEAEYRVQPLAVPPAEADDVRIAESPAVRLFVSRARAVGCECAGALDAVAELCRRLDGLPLALELVAARTRMLPPRAMLDRVAGRLDLAGAGARDAPPRHRTLRATLDWSFALLAPQEQRLFTRLGVFPYDFPLDAAGAVEEGWILDRLELLVDKSLVVRAPADEPRFRLLDTVREYALEQLSAEDEREGRRRHAHWYREFAEQAEIQLGGPEQSTWLDLLEREHANLRAALEFFVASEDGESALRLAASLRRYLDLRGYAVEGRAWLQAAVAVGSNADALLRVKALGGAGVLAAQQGDLSAARSLFERSVALARTTDDDERLASELANLAHAAVLQGDVAPARDAYEEAATLQRRAGSGRNLAITLENLGCLSLLQDDVPRAIVFLDEAHAVGRRTGDTQVLAATLISLARGLLVSGAAAEAKRRLRESLALLTEVGWVEGTAECLELLALAEPRARADQAVLLLGAADQLRSRIGTERQELEQRAYDTAADRARSRLGSEAYQAGMSRGAAMPLGDVLALCQG